jgi:cleavage and polyadenylation specificity factor subunit 1
MGAVLKHWVKNAWQTLAFSKKFNPAKQKYSAYNRELLAIYEAVKHSRHMLEARHFAIFTDHKPSTYAFQQKWDKCSPRQFNHLDFIAQFTTDIQHICGQDNVVAYALTFVESVTEPSYDALAASQNSDDELRTLLGSTTALRLEKLSSPGTTVSSTMIPLPGDLGRTFQLHYGSKSSSPYTISSIQAPGQRRS